MQFAEPKFLHLLWLLPLLAGFFIWSIRHHHDRMKVFADAALLKDLVPGFTRADLTVRAVLLMTVLILGAIALARPQWGFEWRKVKRHGADILVAIDVSKSMLARDVKPSRLERTKLAVRDLLKRLKGDRIGLIAFAGDSFLMCPLTVDYDGFLLSLDDLGTETIPVGGTNIGSAILEALNSYQDGSGDYKSVIIVTDGDNLQGDPMAQALKAKARNIKIHTIGIGSPEGELIQIPDGKGGLEFLKDPDGNAVKSRLNAQLLQQIAAETGGIYVQAGGADFGFDTIYSRELSKLQKREFESLRDKKFYERFQWILTLALVILCWETWMLPVRRKA